MTTNEINVSSINQKKLHFIINLMEHLYIIYLKNLSLLFSSLVIKGF